MSFKVLRFKSRFIALSFATLAALSLVAPQQASARGGWDPGAAAAVGIIGGLALGAVIANQDRGYAPVYSSGRPYGYRDGYGYEGGWHHHPHYGWAPLPPDDCYVVRERVWIPGWGWDFRPRTVCN